MFRYLLRLNVLLKITPGLFFAQVILVTDLSDDFRFRYLQVSQDRHGAADCLLDGILQFADGLFLLINGFLHFVDHVLHGIFIKLIEFF